MNSPARDPQMWTARRLWTVAVFAVAAQFALIHRVSDRTPVYPRTISGHPPVLLAANIHSELLTLMDPTLFARANPNGFSGPAWMAIPDVDFNPDKTNNVLRWLVLAPDQLGAHFREFVQTNRLPVFTSSPQPQPTLTMLAQAARLELVTRSSLRVEGELAGRTLLHLPTPPSQTNTDILKPSEVELKVDARGITTSVLLLRSSGLKLADQLAVALARDSQFSPDRNALKQSLTDPNAGQIFPRMIFNWHTVPAPAPDGSGANPR